ncbi:MAG: long-chain fatty acid--CoA ligase [Cytophagaceae bacterium]|nr:long-chain fatty acid--CoA ligase [Gemmatimonadaceae bacterium]
MYARGPERQSKPGTLVQIFFDAVRKYDKPDALKVRRDGQWHDISHRALADQVRWATLGMEALGLARGDRVAILSENRPEWAIADWACVMLGVADVPIYPTLPAEQVPYLLNDSGAVAIFVSTAAQAAKIASIRQQVTGLKHVIAFDADARSSVDLVFSDLIATGRTADSAERGASYEAAAQEARPDDMATIIYTSGTTGAPKGVMLTHDNFYSNVMANCGIIEMPGDDVALSFLPLSHIFERTGDYWFFSTGTTIAYVDSFDLVPTAMTEVRPTIAMSVPRLYEKMYARVLENALSGSAVKRRIFFWARAVAERFADAKLAGLQPSGWLTLQYAIAQKLVFSKLKERTGGRLRYFISGGAPLAPEINKFFYAAGLTILEGYGLTETSPTISVNQPDKFRIGTVGPPGEGVEVQIAADGEILARGPLIMKGYYNKPDATREAVDAEGWFHTGDIGVIEDGFLRITDRKKDLIVTANGKNIAPQPIENMVKTNPFVAQAVMLGDRRKFPVLLVVPNFQQLEKWAKEKQLTWSDHGQLVAQPAVQTMMEQQVRSQLTGLAHFETPGKIALLEHDFTVESGELTPTLKVKRRVIDQRYKAVIDALYVGAVSRDS